MGTTYTVRMPDIGEGVVEGEVIQWLKRVGDSVGQDEPVVIVMTDKATVELPSPYPGKLTKQHYQPGQNAIKDKPLYEIELAPDVSTAGTENVPIKEQDEKKASVSAPPKTALPAPTVTAAPICPRGEGARALATPHLRKLAKDLAIDINAIPGSGPGGRVVLKDIRTHFQKRSTTYEEPVVTPLEGDDVRPLQGIRRLTARHVAASKASIPHFTYCDTADVTHLVEFRDKLQGEAQKRGLHLTFTPLFLRALTLTLKEYPECNAAFDARADALVVRQPHNIGIAMKTPLGLIVPVLKDVQKMSFEELVRSYDELRKRAVEGKLKPQDMKDATITLSNFGTEGGRWATPVINAPEVTILATARIHPEAVVRSKQVVIHPMLNCSWSFDHRVIDGDMAAAFSNTFIKLLENPIRLT